MDDPHSIYNWRRLDDRLTTSGQPTEEQLAGLRGLGVDHVINLALHTHPKALPDEAGSVARLGMTYVHIPVEFGQPTEDDFARFCAAMTALNDRPVHVHCIANYRVSDVPLPLSPRRARHGRGDRAHRSRSNLATGPGLGSLHRPPVTSQTRAGRAPNLRF